MYADAADLRARYPERDLAQLSDPQGAVVDEVVLSGALADASAEIDGYLQGRYALPVADPPAVLKRIACDIAMYRLLALRPLGDLEDARNRYSDAVRYLESVSRGVVQLGIGAGAQSAPQEAGPEAVSATRLFTRDTMQGL